MCKHLKVSLQFHGDHKPKMKEPTWKWLYRNSFLSTWKLPNLSPWNPRVLYKKCCDPVHGNILHKIYSDQACWTSKRGSVQVLILDSVEALLSSEELASLRILWNCWVINRNWGKYFGAASSTGLMLINELTYIDMTGAGKGRERKCEGPQGEVLGWKKPQSTKNSR